MSLLASRCTAQLVLVIVLSCTHQIAAVLHWRVLTAAALALMCSFWKNWPQAPCCMCCAAMGFDFDELEDLEKERDRVTRSHRNRFAHMLRSE